MYKNFILTLGISIFGYTTIILSNDLLSSKFVIRELNYEDRQEIDELAALFQDDKEIQEMTGGITEKYFESLLVSYQQIDKELLGRIFVCKDQKICGMVKCNYFAEGTTLKYETLAVNKNYRGHGIASLLMKYAQDQYNDKLLNKASLVVYPYNLAAMRCYTKQGFYISWDITINKIGDFLYWLDHGYGLYDSYKKSYKRKAVLMTKDIKR